jgi:methyl-accepting chemotaxis protein
MKKILAFALCVILMVTILTIPAYATTEAATELSTTEVVVNWVKSHIEEISVIGSLIMYAFYEIRKHGKLNLSMGVLNNNAVKIAEDSSATIKKALDEVKDIAEVVNKYKEEFEALLGEVRKSAEEKLTLEETLSHVEGFLKTSKIAMLEVSNEVAELLCLANIPMSKRDELYSRHMKAVHELEAVEKEVTGNDGKEA